MRLKVLVVVLIMVLVAASLPFANAQDPAASSGLPWWTACEEDLTGQTLNFYHFGDLSATYAFITVPLVSGFTDAANYINANGGLCGAQIQQVYEDTANEVERAQASWDKYSAEEDAYSIFLYNSTDGELLRDQAAEQQIVLFNSAASEVALYGENGEPGWQFSIIPLYTDQMGAFCDYIADPANREVHGVEGDPVIGHLSWPNAFGRSSSTPATEAYCESVGVQVIDTPQFFLPDTADLSPLVTALTEEGANIIYTTTLATGPANIAKTIGAMDMENPPLLAGVNWVLDTSVIALGGEDAFGIVGNLPFLWWDELENPGVQLVTQQWVENHLSQATDEAGQRQALGLRNIAYINAWAALDLWGEAMIRTINEVGYENLSGEAFFNVLTNDFQYDALQGVLPIHWTETDRAGHTTRIGTIQLVPRPDGEGPGILPLTDWVTAPDLRAVGGADVPG